MLNRLLYLGLAFITIGTMLKIQHWSNGGLVQSIGIFIEACFFVMVVFELFSSKKLGSNSRMLLISMYITLPTIIFLFVPALLLIFAVFILGSYYLTKIRRTVL